MAISYTEEMKLALLDSGSGNWGAVQNGLMTSIDAGYEITLTADEDLSAGQYKVIYIDSSDKMKLAKADADATMPAIGLLPNNVDNAVEGKVRVSGWIENGGWAWTPGALLYLSASTAGALTETKPTKAQVIGVAKTATKILIIPNLRMSITETRIIDLTLATSPGDGSATGAIITGAWGIIYTVDGIYANRNFVVPPDWDGVSDFVLKMMVQNEIAEDDGDDVSFDVRRSPISDGDTNADSGATEPAILNLTGGDEAINKVNLVSAILAYDESGFPISAGDIVTLKITANLGGGGECTGPLWVISWWIEYTATIS